MKKGLSRGLPEDLKSDLKAGLIVKRVKQETELSGTHSEK